mgnify:CR=1 FL=1
MTLAEFFYMGGYAFYVWTAYGICFIVLLATMISPMIKRKQLLRKLALKEQRQS